MLWWFLAEHAQSSPRLYTNNKKSRRILCDIPSIQIRSADIFSSFYEKFWSSLHQKKTNMFFSTSSSIYVWWWTWSSILRAEQEFFFFFTHVFCEDLSLKSCFDIWRPFYFHFYGICLYFVLYKSVNVFV